MINENSNMSKNSYVTKKLGWADYFNSKYSEAENGKSGDVQYKLLNPQPDLRNKKKQDDRYGFHD